MARWDTVDEYLYFLRNKWSVKILIEQRGVFVVHVGRHSVCKFDQFGVCSGKTCTEKGKIDTDKRTISRLSIIVQSRNCISRFDLSLQWAAWHVRSFDTILYLEDLRFRSLSDARANKLITVTRPINQHAWHNISFAKRALWITNFRGARSEKRPGRKRRE